MVYHIGEQVEARCGGDWRRCCILDLDVLPYKSSKGAAIRFSDGIRGWKYFKNLRPLYRVSIRGNELHLEHT